MFVDYENKIIVSENESETKKVALALAKTLPDGLTIALNGTLGAGKTRLVQYIAEASGVPIEDVSSPTFVLVREYFGDRPIYHFDAYRLKDTDEFWELGPEEYFESGGWVFIEWADRIEAALPKDYLQLDIEILAAESRRFRFSARGDLELELVDRILNSFARDEK